MNAHPLPSAERIRSVFYYDQDTGVFTWKQTTSNAAQAGKRAGGQNSKGYTLIRLDGGSFKAGRLAWLFVTGEDPGELEIDHKNRMRSDDRFDNLRLASRKINCENIGIPKHNTSGIKGVSRHSRSGRWEAYIYHHKRRIQLGTFSAMAEAIEARKAAELKLFTGTNTTEG